MMLEKALRYIFITAVIAACLVPSAGMLIFGESQPAANEILAQRPALTDDEGKFNKDITDDITDYIADRFAFRQQFITAYAKLQADVFGVSAADKVLLGKSDGESRWLYYSNTKDDWLRRNVISAAQADDIARTLALMQEYAVSQGAQLVFTVAPDKNSIYPEYMPDLGEASGDVKNIKRLVAALENEGVTYADLTSALHEMSDKGRDQPIYYRLDSHWTALGAAAGFKTIAESMGISYHDWLDEKYSYEKVHKGDLYEMLYPAGKELDYDAVFERRHSFAYLQEAIDDAGASVYEPSGIRYGDDGAPPYDSIRIDTYKEDSAADVSASLLMFRDSFGNALYPFMADAFERATFSRQTPYRMDWLAGGVYNYCVIEIVERNIPDLLTKAPVMPAPQRGASAAVGGTTVSENDINMSLDDNCDIVGYVKVSGVINNKLVKENKKGRRIFIKAGQNYYEASPAGADADGNYIEGVFTAFIPGNNISDGNDLSVILV